MSFNDELNKPNFHKIVLLEIYYQPQGSTDGSYEEFYIRISSNY